MNEGVTTQGERAATGEIGEVHREGERWCSRQGGRVKRDREIKQAVGIGQVIERVSRSLKAEMGLISHRRRSQGRNGGTKEKAMVSRRAAPDP